MHDRIWGTAMVKGLLAVRHRASISSQEAEARAGAVTTDTLAAVAATAVAEAVEAAEAALRVPAFAAVALAAGSVGRSGARDWWVRC